MVNAGRPELGANDAHIRRNVLGQINVSTVSAVQLGQEESAARSPLSVQVQTSALMGNADRREWRASDVHSPLSAGE